MSSVITAKPEKLRNKLLLRDIKLEMKKEFDRRKKLRLQQVRQQSKDLAYSLREKVRLEKTHQENLNKKEKQKHLNQWQEEKLKELQELYKHCLEDVGQSHVKAAEQPYVESIYLANQKINAEKAASRGMEARRKKKLVDDENRHQGEAPLIRKQLVRTKEDIRSIFVSSLSTSSATCSKLSSEVLHQKPNTVPHVHEQESEIERHPKVRVLQEIPCNIPFERVEPESEIIQRPVEINKATETSNSRTCTDCAHACCCHGRTVDRTLRRRCFSENRLASDTESEYDSDSTWPPRSPQSDYSRQTTSVVRCYDYTNNFRKKYKKPILITKHGQRKPDVKSLQEVQSEIELEQKKNKSLEEMADRGRQRSRLAIYKNRINRDFDNLRKELEILLREERSLAGRTRPNTLRNVNQPRADLRQRRMEETLRSPEKIVTVTKTESVVTLDPETPNVLNVSRYQHSREPSPAQPTPFETNLSQLLTRIEARRKLLFDSLKDSVEESLEDSLEVSLEDSLKTSPEKVTEFVQKGVHFPPEVNLPEASRITPDIVDVRVKSPNDMRPLIDVEVQESGERFGKKKKRDDPEPFDGITVTVRVNRDPSKSVSRTSTRPKQIKAGYESGSTTYTSPPDKVTPSNKIVVDSLVHEISVKGKHGDNLQPYINRLLTMSRHSVAEISGSLNELEAVQFGPMIEPRPVSASDDEYVSNRHDESEHLTSMHGALTQQYINKLLQMSNTFKGLLEAESPHVRAVSPASPAYIDLSPIPRYIKPADARVDPITGLLANLNQSVISAESSYFNLPPHMKNEGFPIHQPHIATDHKKYPKADQTFQELADVVQAQAMLLTKVPQPVHGYSHASSAGPVANSPEFLSAIASMDIMDRDILRRLNVSEVPSIPDIQKMFSFIQPQFLPPPDPNDSNAQSETFDVFQGLNMEDFNYSSPRNRSPSPRQRPVGPTNYQVYTAKVETETTDSEKLNFLPKQNLPGRPNNLSPLEGIESEFQKMGLGWAGATLRKTREAAELSADSSSSKNVSFSPSKPRRQTTHSGRQHDRSARSAFKSRFSSPINLETPPPQMFSTSIDSINSGVSQYTKKKKKKTTKTIACVRTPASSDLSAPNVSLRAPHTGTLSMKSSPKHSRI